MSKPVSASTRGLLHLFGISSACNLSDNDLIALRYDLELSKTKPSGKSLAARNRLPLNEAAPPGPQTNPLASHTTRDYGKISVAGPTRGHTNEGGPVMERMSYRYQ